MVEKILSGLYRIIVPLPNSPLKDLNAYVIKGEDRHLIIDTGFNRGVCFEAMQQGIAELGLDLRRTDFMLTHMHSDHTGLVSRLAAEGSKIYISRIDSHVFDAGFNWHAFIEFAKVNGFPAEDLESAFANHPGIKYSPKKIPAFTLRDEGDILEYGGYRLRCIATPGHTQGHMCLYDPDQEILFSGDHVLYDITPHIESWSYLTNALSDYLLSLDKISALPVRLVLPGHRNMFKDLKGRIEALKHHHRLRAEEVMSVLGEKSLHAYDIASGMTWDIDCATWRDYPLAQRWFATGEAIAHLRYLESEGKIFRNTHQKMITFSAVKG